MLRDGDEDLLGRGLLDVGHRAAGERDGGGEERRDDERGDSDGLHETGALDGAFHALHSRLLFFQAPSC